MARPRIQKQCAACKKEFWVHPSRNTAKFCSKICAGNWASKIRVGKNGPAWKGGKAKRTCKICSKEFEVYPSMTTIVCSRECKSKWISEHTRGALSCRWKGGISPIANKIRSSMFYTQWRQQCFVRDDFTCQICNQAGGELEVHHQIPFSKLLQEAKTCLPLLPIYDAAMLYSPLWKLENGIVLCKRCHLAER
jgi:5-methylcytosine-specific restriction endonuclease McrA